MAFKDLKKLLFDVYDHRIENAHEINGLTNNQYCALNEYLLVYLIDVYKTREEAERMLVTILINLRYFYD